MANKVLTAFNGKIPMTVDELVQLPGVGRKTANVITSVIDQQPNMAVDTHVFRVSKRIGLVPQTASTPLAVEKELIKNIPESLVHKAITGSSYMAAILALPEIPNANNVVCRQLANIFRSVKINFREYTFFEKRCILYTVKPAGKIHFKKVKTYPHNLKFSIILATVWRLFIL